MNTTNGCSLEQPQAGNFDPIRRDADKYDQQLQPRAGKSDPSLILSAAIQVNTINSHNLE
jgi:hypothetical protein